MCLVPCDLNPGNESQNIIRSFFTLKNMTNIVSGMNENLSKESHGRHLITVDKFFTLFLEELEQNKRLWPYYKFLQDPKKLKFR